MGSAGPEMFCRAAVDFKSQRGENGDNILNSFNKIEFLIPVPPEGRYR